MTRHRTGRRFAAGLALTAVIAAAGAYALMPAGMAQVPANATAVQRDIAFHPDRVEIKTAGTVTFINEDPFGHNVYSESPGGEFDIGRQQMGQTNVITFRRSGTFTAQCRIHPKMRLEIVVTP